MHVEWAGQEMVLSPERAVYWPKRKTIIIADPHFGKGAFFSGKGVPVPAGVMESDLRRLTDLLRDFKSKRLVVLGDFYHARGGVAGHTSDVLSAWRKENPRVEIILVRGNHDCHAGDPDEAWNIECLQPPFYDHGIFFYHEAPANPMGPTMAGHIHPAVSMRGSAGERLRVPCFWFSEQVATLPAYGNFTGTHVVRPTMGDAVVLVGPDELVRVA